MSGSVPCDPGCACGKHNNPTVGRKRKQDPGTIARHDRTRKARGRADDHLCISCDDYARDWAQIHGSNGIDPNAYVPLCRRCHLVYDRYPNFQLEDLFNETIREVSLSIVMRHMRNGEEVTPE